MTYEFANFMASFSFDVYEGVLGQLGVGQLDSWTIGRNTIGRLNDWASGQMGVKLSTTPNYPAPNRPATR